MSEEQARTSHFWPQLRQLIIFQVKLYVDAFRDLIMSPVSVVAFVLDMLQGKSGTDSNFEGALRFGRRTELAINLFNQYDDENREIYDVDTAIVQIEESVRRHYQEGGLSEKARQAMEKTLDALRGERPPEPAEAEGSSSAEGSYKAEGSQPEDKGSREG